MICERLDQIRAKVDEGTVSKNEVIDLLNFIEQLKVLGSAREARIRRYEQIIKEILALQDIARIHQIAKKSETERMYFKP